MQGSRSARTRTLRDRAARDARAAVLRTDRARDPCLSRAPRLRIGVIPDMAEFQAARL